MRQFSGDLQILLYTTKEQFKSCRAFYEALLGEAPYYTWEDGPEDRGAKFHAGRGTISVLCQDHRGAPGPSMMNLETEDVDQAFARVRRLPCVKILSDPATKPYGTRCFSIEDPCGNQMNIYRSNH